MHRGPMAARRRLPALLLRCTALADDATVSVLLDINGAKQPLIIPTSGAVDAACGRGVGWRSRWRDEPGGG